MKKYFLIVILSSIFLSGCRVNQRFVPPIRRPLGRNLPTRSYSIDSATDPNEAAVISQPKGVLTLKDALALALMNNPRLEIYSWEIRAAQARQLQASMLPNPEIKIEMEEIGGPGDRRGIDSSETSIELGQLIELGDKRALREDIAALDARLAGWDYEAQRLDVYRDVAVSFIDLLGAQENMSLNRELTDLSEKVLQAVSQQVAAGRDSPVEQKRAAVNLANFQIEKRKAQKQLNYARLQLAALWGEKTALFQQAAGQLKNVTAVMPEIEIAGLLEENPDLARWREIMQKSKTQVKLAKANAIPDPTIAAGCQYFNESNDSTVLFGVSLPLPLFDQNRAGISLARANLARSARQNQLARLEAGLDLSATYTELDNAYHEINELNKTVLPTAREVFNNMSQGYRQGKFSYLAVLDAQQSLFETRKQYLDALITYHKAKARLERLIGRNVNSLTTD